MNFFEEHYTALREATGASEGEAAPTWKVLLVDDETLRHVACFKVGDLRDLGVVLHLHVNEPKEELAGVVGVYLIAPSDASLSAFAADLRAAAFDEVWLNFSRPIERDRLESLCAEIIKTGKTAAVTRIRQVYFPVFPLADDCFTLKGGDLAAALSAICLSRRCEPVFAFPRQSSRCAEIAERVTADCSPLSPYVLPPQMRRNKLLFLLGDSPADLLPALAHSLGYAQTISDEFGVWGAAPGDSVAATLDVRNDRFFARHFLAELPTAALALAEQLREYKERFAAFEDASNDGDAAEKLERLPEMTEMRKQNKLHTNICSALMKAANERGRDRYAALATAALRLRALTGEQLAEAAELLGEAGDVEDKLRFLALLAATNACAPKELAKLVEAVGAAPALTAEQRAFLARAKGGAIDGGYFSAFKDSGKRLIQAKLGSDNATNFARCLLELFRRKEAFDEIALKPENAALAEVTEIVCVNAIGGAFAELADLRDVARKIGKSVAFGFVDLPSPTAALNRYLEMIK